MQMQIATLLLLDIEVPELFFENHKHFFISIQFCEIVWSSIGTTKISDVIIQTLNCKHETNYNYLKLA